jgi:hypothetical protein
MDYFDFIAIREKPFFIVTLGDNVGVQLNCNPLTADSELLQQHSDRRLSRRLDRFTVQYDPHINLLALISRISALSKIFLPEKRRKYLPTY